MSKRITRKQIKEDIRHDEVQSALSATYDQIQGHRNLAIGVGVAVLVLGIGAASARAFLAHSEESAANSLAQAIKLFDAPIQEEDAKPEDPLEPSFASVEAREQRAREALEAVSGGAAEDMAGLYLADLAIKSGDKATARKHWEAFLGSHKNHIVGVSIRLNLLRLDREEGKVEEVVQELEAELEAKTLPEDVVLFELGQTLDALDRGDEAKDYYQRILDDHPQSPYSAKAREKTASS